MALLLERFYELDGGNITIDGVDISKCSPQWLRGKCIGFISQVCLFSIFYNRMYIVRNGFILHLNWFVVIV